MCWLTGPGFYATRSPRGICRPVQEPWHESWQMRSVGSLQNTRRSWIGYSSQTRRTNARRTEGKGCSWWTEAMSFPTSRSIGVYGNPLQRQGNCPRLGLDVLIGLLARPDLSKTDVRVYLALAILTVGQGHGWTSTSARLAEIGRVAHVHDRGHVARSLLRLRAAELYNCERIWGALTRRIAWPPPPPPVAKDGTKTHIDTYIPTPSSPSGTGLKRPPEVEEALAWLEKYVRRSR